ncbi:MAG TPA: hypothetical protein VI139_07760 [Gemmatimonadales bacterium]
MSKVITRRAALRAFGLVALGATVGCTPLRVVLDSHPRALDADDTLEDRVLRAFLATVIPGIDADAADAIRIFHDPAYPFAKYAKFFAGDLCRRAAQRAGGRTFDQLSPVDRTAVVQEGLAADGTTRKLYGGAIYLIQIATYAGVYDDRGGCALIGFDGGYHFRPRPENTYPDPDRFLAAAITPSGNFA